MADIPLLKRRRIGFDVELQRQGSRTVRKSLVFIRGVEGEPLCPCGEIERIAVPVKDRRVRVGERLQAGGSAFAGEFDVTPADFLDRSAVDARAQSLRHELA